MNVLALGAHFDDIELGCAGALCRHRMAGDRVICFVATSSGFAGNSTANSRSDATAAEEGRTAAALLDVELIEGKFQTLHLEFEDTLNYRLVRLIEANDIDLIYTHWHGDVHHDHHALHLASLHAGRHVPRILLYRSNWYTGIVPFSPNFFVDISNVWDRKEAAILSHQSELKRVGSSWISWSRNEAENFGKIAGTALAEGFVCLRWLVK